MRNGTRLLTTMAIVMALMGTAGPAEASSLTYTATGTVNGLFEPANGLPELSTEFQLGEPVSVTFTVLPVDDADPQLEAGVYLRAVTAMGVDVGDYHASFAASSVGPANANQVTVLDGFASDGADAYTAFADVGEDWVAEPHRRPCPRENVGSPLRCRRRIG